EDAWVKVEPGLPHLVAHHEHWWSPRFPVLRRDAAAHLRRHSQKLERVRRYVAAVESFRALAGSPKNVFVAAAGVSAEDVILLPVFQIFRRLQEGPTAGAAPIQVVNGESRHPRSILIREGRQQHVLNDAEHSGARADSQRQGEHCEKRESWSTTDPAHAVSQILPERLHG